MAKIRALDGMSWDSAQVNFNMGEGRMECYPEDIMKAMALQGAGCTERTRNQ